MTRSIAAVTLVVADYDAAIAWYTEKLGFALLEDTPMGGGKRWVRVAPSPAPAATGTALLLAQAKDDAQAAAIGRQAGGRVFLFLHTDDFDRDYAAMRAAGVHFRESPRDEAYGRVVVFEDLYGNAWDFIGPAASARSAAPAG